MGESTDSNYSFSSTGSPVLENLCAHKERPCNRLCIIESPYCALHTIDHSDLPYIQCSSVIDSFQCKRVVHKALRTRYCPYHEKVKVKTSAMRSMDSSPFVPPSDYRRSDSRPNTKLEEPHTLLEGLYRSKDNDAYYDNFSSDGESIDSEDTEDPLKHAGLFSTEELLNEAMNRWKKYLGLCVEALGELRYEMIDAHKESLNYEVDPRIAENDNTSINSPRFQQEYRAYKQFLKIPKTETVHANSSMMQKFMINYRHTKPQLYCQFSLPRSGGTKDRCSEVVVPCTAFCLRHLTLKIDNSKTKTYLDKLPNQVLFKRCGGGPDNDCTESVVRWHSESRCLAHTGLEDAIYDPVVSDRNKLCLRHLEFDTVDQSGFINK